MKKLLTFSFLVFFLAGCQAGNTVVGQNSAVSPDDQFTKTGMVRTLYSEGGTSTQYQQYLMNTSQQVEPTVDMQQLLSGPVKQCLDEMDPVKANDCFDNYFTQRTLAGGPLAAFADMRALYNISPELQSDCHPLAHAIGRAAVQLYPDVTEAYMHGDDFCWSGYYHGVMEAIMAKVGIQNLATELPQICSKIQGAASYSFNYYNCVHGAGHGLMDLAGDNLRKALGYCDDFPGWWEEQSCYSGVFMQNVINDGSVFHSADLKPSDPVYPCDSVADKYKDQCYLMQTSYMLKVNHYNFPQTFQICANVDKGYSVTCYRSLGRDASGSTISNLDKTRSICLMGKSYEQQSECLVGAVKDFVSYYHSDAKAKQLCESLVDPSYNTLQETQALDVTPIGQIGDISTQILASSQPTQQGMVYDPQTMEQYCLQTVTGYYKTF